MGHQPASIVGIEDVSDSMCSFGYLTGALSDLANFINLLQNQDRFSVISFSDDVYPVYPTSFGMTNVTVPSIVAATQAIQALQCKNMTNISAAIQEGASLLSGARAPLGMVLLSDGLWNRGTDPTKNLPSIPIFTIALGNNGQVATLQSIASQTGASFQMTPDDIGLASIYFDIIGQVGDAQTVYNHRSPLTPSQHVTRTTAPVRVSSGQDSVDLAVNWDNPALSYTSGTPTGSQVGVELLDPNFNPVTGHTLQEGDGFVVFRVPNPIAGDYQAITTYNGSGTAQITSGGFDPDSQVALALESDAQIVATGTRVPFRAVLTDGGSPLPAAMARAEVDSPAVDVGQVIAAHREELAGVGLPEDLGDHPDPDRARLELLDRRRPADEKLLARRSRSVAVEQVEPGVFAGQLAADQPGIHCLHLEVAGPHPEGGSFMRTRKLSVLAE